MDERKQTILLVEDDRFLRRAAEAMLQRRGFTVFTASDGEEAVRLAREAQPSVVLLDVIMPKLQGFEVLRILKEDPATTRTPVIMLSNLGQESDVQRALDRGARGYFVKANLSLEDLVKRVEEALAS
jgi:DNA-binding response OmpR family regulator